MPENKVALAVSQLVGEIAEKIVVDRRLELNDCPYVAEIISAALSERESKVQALVEAAKDELDYSCQKGLLAWCRCANCRKEHLTAALSALGESK